MCNQTGFLGILLDHNLSSRCPPDEPTLRDCSPQRPLHRTEPIIILVMRLLLSAHSVVVMNTEDVGPPHELLKRPFKD